MFDMNSMLLGGGISGLCLSFTMLSFWLVNRGASFMVTWSVGVMVLVGHVFAFWFYANGNSPVMGTLACMLLPVGAACIYAAGRQFVDGVNPVPVILWLSIPYLVVVPPVFALGYDGIALVAQNAVTTAVFLLCGLTYLRIRREASFSIGVISGLYLAVAVSFALCGVMVLVEGQWQLGYPPQNWAEELNVVIAVVAMTGIGAFTLSLEQSRLAGRHQAAAMTDAMTGLKNRRGLVSGNAGTFGPGKAVVLFDLDHFKQVNDRYGHAVGDEVIRRFADTLRTHGRAGDHMVRLGGEEFAMVMDRVTPRQVRKVAERVAAAFAEVEMLSDEGEPFRCTVSAGIAFGGMTGIDDLNDVMTRADRALYTAKREGRNRVETEEWRLAG